MATKTKGVWGCCPKACQSFINGGPAIRLNLAGTEFKLVVNIAFYRKKNCELE
jgi:hypothetical protein